MGGHLRRAPHAANLPAHPAAGASLKKLTALLDAQCGVQYEGEHAPTASHADHTALRTWNLLANGTGGIDWSGLPIVAAHLGIADIGGLMDRLEVIKLHKPPADQEESTS